MRIAIVNDLGLAVEALRRAVSSIPGASVAWVARDGGEAIALCARDRPDLVLMDLAMPRMDGWQATRQLRARPHLAHIPVIAITGHVTGEDLDRAFEAGCVDYLPKPFTYDALIRMVRFHLSLAKE